MNAEQAVEEKFGIILHKFKGGPGKLDFELSDPLFSAKDIEKAFNELLYNPIYTTNM